MGHALAQAAADAGIRLTLLDTCYLTADVDGRPVDGVQRRFSDGTADAWAERVAALRDGPGLRIGVAAHSVRAVPRAALPVVDEAAGGRPLHVHLSEQPAENDACLAAYGLTPTGLLAAEGLLGPRTHRRARHPPDRRRHRACSAAAAPPPACARPPSATSPTASGRRGRCATPGARSRLGGDQHAVIDPFEEARGLEMHERLASGERGRFAPATLLDALTAHGASRLARRRAAGTRGARRPRRRLGSTHRAPPAADPAQVLLAATAADVDTVRGRRPGRRRRRAARARRRRRAAAGRDRAAVGGRMSSVVVTGIGGAHHARPRARHAPRRGGRRRGGDDHVGRPGCAGPGRGPADRRRRPRRDPGLRRLAHPPRLRRRPGGRVRRPDARRALRRRRDRLDRRRHPGRGRRRAARAARHPGRRAARPGHHDRRDQERVRADRRGRGARAPPGRAR